MIPVASPDAERDFAARPLTTRETEAARSVLAGMTAEAAAREMGVSASTVGSLRNNAYRKLDVPDARALRARYAPDDASADALDTGASYQALLAHGLSETQARVLSRVNAGEPTARIAAELHLAEGTVRAARAAGYRHLGVHSRAELAQLMEREREAPRKLRGRRLAAACLVGVMALAVGLAAARAAEQAPPPGQTDPATVETDYGPMPNVVGMDAKDAWDALVEAGFLPQLHQAREDGTTAAAQAGTVTSARAVELTGAVEAPVDPEGVAHPELDHVEWRAVALVGLKGMRQVPPRSSRSTPRSAPRGSCWGRPGSQRSRPSTAATSTRPPTG